MTSNRDCISESPEATSACHARLPSVRVLAAARVVVKDVRMFHVKHRRMFCPARPRDPPTLGSSYGGFESAEAQSAKAEALISPIIPVYDAPKPPPRRLTMTLPVMASAARVVVAAFGAEKARIVNHAVRHAEDRSPVAELLRRAPSSMVLLDGDSH
jgi:hypothetical protein